MNHVQRINCRTESRTIFELVRFIASPTAYARALVHRAALLRFSIILTVHDICQVLYGLHDFKRFLSFMIIFLFHCISGHGKFETLGALGISCMLLATGGGIAWHAVDILMGLSSAGPEMVNQAMAHAHSHGQGGHHHAIDMDHPILALNMTLVSIGVKEG